MAEKRFIILVLAASAVSVCVTLLVVTLGRSRPQENGAFSTVVVESKVERPTGGIDMKAVFEQYDVVKAGRYREAMETYKKAMRGEPPYTGGPAAGVYYARTGKYEQAIEVSEQRLDQGPNAYYTIAWVHAKVGRYDEAVLACKRTIETFPDYSKIWHVLGWVYAAQGQADKAIEACQQASKLEPDSAEVHYALGRVYAAMGDNEKAIESYDKSVRLKSDFAPAYLFLGLAYAEAGKREEAIAAWRNAILYDKYSPEAHFALGAAYEQEGRYADAIARLEDAARYYYTPESESRILEMGIKPDMAGLYCAIGACNLRLGEYIEAQFAFQNAVKLEPGHPGAHFGLALSYLGLGDRKAALAEYEVVKASNQGPMSQMLADIISRQGQQ